MQFWGMVVRWIKAVFLLLLSVSIVGGGGYAYVWFKAKSYIDDTLAAVLPGYTVEYERLVLDPRGEVRLEELQATPRRYSSPITVKYLSLRADAPLFFLQGSPVGTGEWPSFLSIELSKLRIDLSADFMELVELESASTSNELVNIAALGCGDVNEFSLPVMKAMGIPEVQADLDIRLDPDDENGRIVLSSQLELLGISSQNLALEMSLTPGYLTPQTLLAASPRLQKFSFAYQDLGLAARRNSFCAAQSGLSIEDYRSLHSGLVKAQARELGMDVPGLLWNAYEYANTSGAYVEMSMAPSGGMGSELFVLMNAPHVLADRLNLGLSINSQRIELAGLDWRAILPSAEVAETLKPKEEALVDVSKLEPVGLPKGFVEERSVRKRYHSASFEQLPEYLQYNVRLFTYYGSQIEGRLLSVDGDKIVVLRRLNQGSASYPVDREKLEVIEVYR